MSKLASRSAPEGQIAFWATIASLLPIAVFAILGSTDRLTRPLPSAIVAGLCAGIATVAFYAALKRGPASVVLPLTGMYILIPAVLGVIFLREPLSFAKMLGLVFAGLAVFFLSR